MYLMIILFFRLAQLSKELQKNNHLNVEPIIESTTYDLKIKKETPDLIIEEFDNFGPLKQSLPTTTSQSTITTTVASSSVFTSTTESVINSLPLITARHLTLGDFGNLPPIRKS